MSKNFARDDPCSNRRSQQYSKLIEVYEDNTLSLFIFGFREESYILKVIHTDIYIILHRYTYRSQFVHTTDFLLNVRLETKIMNCREFGKNCAESPDIHDSESAEHGES